jgi:hypothetical protein
MPTLRPFACKAEREVHGGGRLADAALAGGDRDDRLDARHAAPCLMLGGRAGGRGALGRRGTRPARKARARACRRRFHAAALLFGRQRHDAPSTPGMAFTARSAAARSGSISCARAAGTVTEKNTLELAMKMSDTSPSETMLPRKVRALDRLQRFENGFLGDGHVVAFQLAEPQIVAFTRKTKRAN